MSKFKKKNSDCDKFGKYSQQGGNISLKSSLEISLELFRNCDNNISLIIVLVFLQITFTK